MINLTIPPRYIYVTEIPALFRFLNAREFCVGFDHRIYEIFVMQAICMIETFFVHVINKGGVAHGSLVSYGLRHFGIFSRDCGFVLLGNRPRTWLLHRKRPANPVPIPPGFVRTTGSDQA